MIKFIATCFFFAGTLFAQPPYSVGEETQPSEKLLWKQDLLSVIEQAQSSGKAIYVAFTGLDWSVASKQWNRKIFKSNAFSEFAEEHLHLILVNAQRKPKMNKLQLARIQAMAIEFDIKSYPTFILLNSDGHEIHRHSYLDVSPQDYVEALENLIPPS